MQHLDLGRGVQGGVSFQSFLSQHEWDTTSDADDSPHSVLIYHQPQQPNISHKMKSFVAFCVLFPTLAATPFSSATREAVDEDIVNAKKTAMKSKILSHHNGLSFVQAMDVLRMHRSKNHPRHDHDVSSRQLRKDSQSKSAKSKGAKSVGCICYNYNTDDIAVNEELDQCKHDLEELKKPVPKYLFVQMADGCICEKDEDGSIFIHSTAFHKDTEQFSDKPFRYESTIPTYEFFDKFDSTYFPDVKPNAAITLVNEGESEGVVISVFASAFNRTDDEGKPVYGYKLTQSEEQEALESLKDIIDGKDTEVHDHCSVFIDSTGHIGTQ